MYYAYGILHKSSETAQRKLLRVVLTQYSIVTKDIMRINDMTSRITDIMAAFIEHTAKNLPDDVITRLKELRALETDPMASEIYDLMFRNLELARELDRPTCQDTGLLQFWIRCGSGFPFMDKLESLLGIKSGEITADRKFSLDATRCIGACGLAPVLTINEEVYGRLTPDMLKGILDKYN
jgi:hypothetical protein